ncbi:group II intron reverse transcriptase/maturase [Rhodoferax sp.]|uniref:group II intron reverse transcriptase/maturase n=1 Tax=Rhodoferax sp. TaxID=50421 RepID=UPI0028422ED8|nr:group II intron reverse transcriptase/maturase [Rhodoferax sp.]MDR3369010.1 group II intron reverse transcriptase/maturase [Rhodoferax sp.]
MQNCKVMRQKPGQPGRAGRRHGEAGPDTASDETRGTLHKHPDTGSVNLKVGTGGLLEKALTRQNLQAAWKRVKANKGAAGVDGLDIEQTAQQLRVQWSDIRQALLAGRYRPSPVRKVMIPKPDGSQRELGIPTVTDRLIQQALLQVLQPLIDPTFSNHSHGFRPGRRAHDAVRAARAYMQSGKRVVVDVDLEKFFDRVNHDILVDRLRKRIDDAGVIRLIRAYLTAGIMAGGVLSERHLGTPQGGPLSPMLANVLLDEVDKALEARGYSFARYADDCNVYVGSKRAGGRSMTEVVQKLRPYLLGWKAYFGLAQTPGVWRELDEWLRHRLRAIQLKHWKRPRTIYLELKVLGATEDVARQVAGNCHRWWRNSAMQLNSVLTIAYFDRLGLSRLS